MKLPQFTLRELFLLVALVAMACTSAILTDEELAQIL
jgi:hypothetical protein